MCVMYLLNSDGPVHILLQIFGEVVVEDVGDVIDVQPAACHVCCNQDSHLMLVVRQHIVGTFLGCKIHLARLEIN